jgi:hypothetical protein
MKKLICTVLLTFAVLSLAAVTIAAQEQPAGPQTEEQKKAKEENEKKAFALLDQVTNEAQFLKLPENRIRIQLRLADLLWARDSERARSIFSLAADGVAELMRTTDWTGPLRRGQGGARNSMQLRQELILTAARHDATLAYQLLAATRPLTTSMVNPNDQNVLRRLELEETLEQSLLSQVAALDPKFALQQAEQLLDKGELSRSLADVLRQLQTKDKDAAVKLEERIIKKLQTSNMLISADAGSLALSLLQPGPRTAETNSSAAVQPLVSASAYQDLLTTVIDAALKTTPQTATSQRRTAGNRGRNTGNTRTANNNTNSRPTDAQTEQANARRLLGGLRALLVQVDQYAPNKAPALRQKMTEVGMTADNRRAQMAQFATAMQQGGTSETLLAAAATAPPAVKSRMYRQAAILALEEGNVDRARQIANDHLEPGARDSVLQTVKFRELANKSEGARIDEIRQALATLSSDGERVDSLLQMAESVRKTSPEFALQLVDQAREYTNRRATGYQQFEQQLRVSAAYSNLGSSQAFEVLEPSIMHLNELLSAAAVLSGFEVNTFRDGEMPIQGGGGLADIVRRYAQQLGVLAEKDYERAQTLASRFQFAEPRVIARLSMAQVLLGQAPTRLSRPNGRQFAFGPRAN